MSDLFHGLVIALLVVGSIFAFGAFVFYGAWWAAAWQVAIGYLVWRGNRNIVNATIAGFVVPTACFLALAAIVGVESVRQFDIYLIAAGMIAVLLVALAPHWRDGA